MNTISELLKDSFERHASKNAVTDRGILTYGQLYDNAARLAAALEEGNVKKGDFVGIYLNRSWQYITAIVSCLIFGYGAVLLDIEYPKDRTDYMIKDSDTKAVIDGAFFENAVTGRHKAEYVPVSPDTNALVVYTSGSTGNPSGVLHDQESVYNAVVRFMNGLDYNENDIYGSSAPYTFIAVGVDIIYPLAVGAAVNIIPRDIVKNPVRFSEYINEHGITATNIPPKILKVFKKTGDSLRISTTGSEKVSNIAPKDFRIMNLYGMSEGFPSVSIFEIDKAYKSTPIGKGDGSLGIYILDDDGREASEGEICVSGHLFTKYLNLEEKTAQAICPNPFEKTDGHKWLFHTKDMGRRLPDGNIEYTNRKDWMLKINGFRVEPGEVEANIKALPQIFDCVVKGFVRKNATPYLAAYYVEKEPVSVEEMRSMLVKKHPYYMVPSYFVRMEALPVNNNGKLDHRALTEPETASMAVNYAAPENDLQKLLCKEIAEILSVKKVGIKDDIFSLGANYEEVMYLAAKFSAYGLDERLIYRYKTVKNITNALSKADKRNLAVDNALALSVPHRITAAQEYYVDCQFYSPESNPTSNSVVLSIPVDKVSACLLKKNMEACFIRHPALSTEFTFDIKGDIVLKYKEGAFVPVECFECTEYEYENRVKNSWKRQLPGFDSLLYYSMIYTTEKCHYVHFDIHRAICDERGIANIIQDVARSMAGLDSAPDYYYLYLESTGSEREKYLGKNAIKQIQEFLEEESCAVAPLKDTESRKTTKKYLYRRAPKDADTYKRAFQAHHVSVELLLIAAGLLSLSRYNNSDEAAVSGIFDARDEAWKKDAVGLMSSALPMGFCMSDYSSLIDMMEAIQKYCSRALEYSDYLMFIGSHPGYRDLLQVEYADNKFFPMDILEKNDVKIQWGDVRASQFHVLAVNMDDGGGLLFRFTYNAECYSKKSVEKFADLFMQAFDICCFGTLKDWQETCGNKNFSPDTVNTSQSGTSSPGKLL